MEFPTLVSLGTSILAPRLAANPEAIVFHEIAHRVVLCPGGLGRGRGGVARRGARDLGVRASPAAWRRAQPLVAAALRASRPGRVGPDQLPGGHVGGILRRSPPSGGGTPSWQLADGPTYRAVSYLKPTLALAAVERTVGSEEIDRAIRLYVDRFRFRRATGTDFRQALADGAGPEAARLFDALFLGDDVVDFSLSRCETTPHPDPRRGWRSFVEVTRTGEARVPVEVEMVFADGTRVRRKWEGTGRSTSWQAEGARLVEARVDPDRKLPLDPTPFDDSRRTAPNGRTGARWTERVSWWVAWAAELAASLG